MKIYKKQVHILVIKYKTKEKYRIYAKDDRDCTNTVEKTFTVVPDKAPKVVIGAEKEQVREELPLLKSRRKDIYQLSQNLFNSGNSTESSPVL